MAKAKAAAMALALTLAAAVLSPRLALAAAAQAGQEQSANPTVGMDKKFDSLFDASRKSDASGAPAAGSVDADAALPDGHPAVGGASDGGGMGPHGRAGMPSLLPPAPVVPASTLANVGVLESVPVLHEGRLKPMITYARHMLLQFSGRTTYEKQSAMQVMARILITPEQSGDFRIFLINNPEVAEALGIAAEKNRRYSFKQLEKSLPKLQELAEKANAVADEKRDIVQKEVLRVFGNLVEFVNLTRTFSFALPNPVYTVKLPETRTQLELKADVPEYSFWDLMMISRSAGKRIAPPWNGRSLSCPRPCT